eukprot:gene3551-11040_t
MSKRSIYDEPPPLEPVPKSGSPSRVAAVADAVETVFRTVRETTTSAQNEVSSAISSATSMFPEIEVPTEIKAMLPTKLPDLVSAATAIKISDIPSSQAQFTALADRTTLAVQDQATFVINDPAARELAIKSAAIGTAGLAALIMLRKRHSIIKYVGSATAATTVAAAAYPQTSMPIIKEGGAKVAALAKDLYADVTAPAPPQPSKPATPVAAGVAATGRSEQASVDAGAAGAGAGAKEVAELAEQQPPPPPQQQEKKAESAWNQARSAVGWSVDNSGSAPSAGEKKAVDLTAAVDVTTEVASLGVLAAEDAKKESKAVAAGVDVEDLGQSKTEDTATYPSRR